MKIELDVKNVGKALKPSKDNIIIYDGSKWYVTTKEDLLHESKVVLAQAEEALEEVKEENKKIKNEFNEHKRTVAEQLLQMSELIKKLYTKENK